MAEVRPDLAAQWHPTQNGDLTPADVVAGTGSNLWWKCPEGPDHEWQASGANRTKGSGCPFCRGLKVSVTNSLATVSPELAAQWHPMKNGELTPAGVVAGTNKKLWWQCPAGPDHEWQAAGNDRIGGNGCPFCRGLKASVTNSLAEVRPDLAAQWHPTLNGDLTRAGVVASTERKLWWKCAEGPDHEWQASGANRTKVSGCPFCRGVMASVTNSLATVSPELAAQWHPMKNGELTPAGVVAGTNKKLWWKCPEGPDHEWQASGASRTKGGGCPFCAGQRVSVTNSVASIPDLAAQWHPTKNGDLTPADVVAGTNKKLWWQCPEGPDHEWQAKGNTRMGGNGCPFCAGYQVSVTNNVASIPDLAAQWHPTKNGELTPAGVVAGTHSALWWKCAEGPDHEWQASGANRTKGRGCPFCGGKRVSVTNSLATVSPELAAQWHPTRNGDLTPADVVAGTNKKLWWQCAEGPDHEWQAAGNTRMGGSGCPSCAEYGYNPAKTGAVYLLCGDEWGKVGISNVLEQRLAQHAIAGAFGRLVAAVTFTDGATPVRIERALCDLIAERTTKRVMRGVSGYTESFPAELLGEVQAELLRLLAELPATDWEML